MLIGVILKLRFCTSSGALIFLVESEASELSSCRRPKLDHAISWYACEQLCFFLASSSGTRSNFCAFSKLMVIPLLTMDKSKYLLSQW